MACAAAAFNYRKLADALASRDKTDIACPLCGPVREAAANRVRKVLRLWRGPGFVSFHCARCGETGFLRDAERCSVNREALRCFQAEAAKRELDEAAVRRAKALALWQRRQPLAGTPAETYLRSTRGIAGALPATLGYLPPRGDYRSALIAAFGIPNEPEPGRLAIADKAVAGVHLIKIKRDGSGKADIEPQKIMIGRSKGTPIVLAPMNDALGLVITEGIEDALHAATGLGAWAAGAASRLPALAESVPSYTDTVSVMADADPDGQHHARELAQRLETRGFAEVNLVDLRAPR
jgi:hypothetical protein